MIPEASVILSYLATAAVLTGVYLISRPRVEGQYMMLFADALWLTFSCMTGNIALGVQSVVLAVLSMVAIKRWRAQGVGVGKPKSGTDLGAA